ncbi:aryl-alcohol dehydrogenase-like predicted oxidoreductase [Paenibacillus taihuensis]|uniref:Aryl-alcohol dehydrogenase-like predicted oxidoreductase n=1 Tax=Paenibacillus taihuensis TaxID=1156355 RepID=A0A3D9S166_9BACL|nr:aldo/keto reductase [Paenibacillus taihuensis]REE86214.1 aryl-alcohol dehydrogenase-like predicted oxidoreductase [Paenibacillus taihuensis]
MEHLTINGVTLSRLLMGTGDISKFNGMEMLDVFAAAGGTTIDTAHQYRRAELTIGEWMAARGNRSRMVIMTKGAHHDDGSPGARVNAEAIRKDLYESLERLQTDYIDLYALHRDEPGTPVGPIMEELNRHLAEGRVRAIGASNWTYLRIQEANDYARANGLKGFMFSSTNLALATANEPRWVGCESADVATCQWHESNGLPLLSWSAQAGGFFTGLFSPEDRSNADMVRVYYNEDNWRRYERARALAARKGVSAMQIALSFVLNRSFPTGAIIGPRTEGELMDSVEAMGIELTAQELEWLDLKREELSA